MKDRSGTPRKLFRTGEVVAESPATRQMLYYYISLGLITEEERTPGGHRLFSEDVFRKIELILKLNRSGYTLREIREIFFRNRPHRRRIKKP
jgi:MerR family mercuric resistance operon transcriptional regulator